MDRLGEGKALRDGKSREAMFLLNNLFFVLFTFTVVIGTVFPLPPTDGWTIQLIES